MAPPCGGQSGLDEHTRHDPVLYQFVNASKTGQHRFWPLQGSDPCSPHYGSLCHPNWRMHTNGVSGLDPFLFGRFWVLNGYWRVVFCMC